MEQNHPFFTRNFVIILIIMILGLGIFIPFASSDPDGLERMAEILGFPQLQPGYPGLIPDYNLAFGNEIIGTWLAGLIGVILILGIFLIIFLQARRRESR